VQGVNFPCKNAFTSVSCNIKLFNKTSFGMLNVMILTRTQVDNVTEEVAFMMYIGETFL
ncbi:hypothetical protein BgiBS90_013039, partial [Biomphalaria glabrata]